MHDAYQSLLPRDASSSTVFDADSGSVSESCGGVLNDVAEEGCV